MEELKFTQDGIDYTIQLAGMDGTDKVIIDKKKGPLEVCEITGFEAGKKRKQVKVKYNHYFTDIEGTLIVNSISELAFDAVSQEDFPYFYGPSRDGSQIDKMCVNGLFIHLFQFMVFDPQTGAFLYAETE